MSSPMFSNPPTGRTGTCQVCGGENLPLLAGAVAEHREQLIRKGIQVDGDRRCDGSLQPPEPGTQERPPKPWRGSAMRRDVSARIRTQRDPS